MRIIRTARRLGYRTVAVFSKADAHSPYVEMADQGVCIGEASPMQSYLSIERILAAAETSGADAVHPGYGFLAEDQEFARACREAGLVFVGPPAEVMAAIGNKAEAKRRMIEMGIPCMFGYHGADQRDERLMEEAERIGYPIMIKAAAGGGGRGMRFAASSIELPGLLRSARTEALKVFGNPELLLEKAIIEPRHIEVQIIADRHGNVIHFGERDCSVQRRHQKIIEEAPSPSVDSALRARMTSTAIRVAQAVAYEGVGTIEFLLDPAGEFFFMEANARLQVEHPVTEALTGFDLVELQFMVASGEPLPIVQSDVTFTGHAIEARLCAEDARHSFVPQAGMIVLWDAPKTLRVDHALRSGLEIFPHYDSMIAKLVSHGRNREEARRRLLFGLEETVALGVLTNKEFLVNCLGHPDFVAGKATTGFIARNADELLRVDDGGRQSAFALAALLYFVGNRRNGKLPTSSTISNGISVSLLLDLDGQRQTIMVQHELDQRYRVVVDDAIYLFKVIDLSESFVRFDCNDLVEGAVYWRDGRQLSMQYRGVSFNVEDVTRVSIARATPPSTNDGKLRALTSGRVVSVLVEVGERVRAGQPIVILEAMKMEHTHVAPIEGTITALNVCVGGQATVSGVIAEIHPNSEASC